MKHAVICLLCSLVRALPHGYPSIPMNGVKATIDMPLMGVGTWKYNDTVAAQTVMDAFKVGYRHVDTAFVYKNQAGVGHGLVVAVQARGLKRGDYFVTSKVPGGLNETATWAALEECLKLLNLEYVDLMLIHWPAPGHDAAVIKQQWLTLEKWAKQGKAKAVGVSHHCQKDLQDIYTVSTLPVALNQNQYHIGMAQDSQPRLHDKLFNEKRGIIYMSYSSLCGPCPPPTNMELITGDLVVGIGQKHNKTGAQVSLRWLVQQGIPVIPKSNKIEHLRSNFEIFDFELTGPEMQALSSATSPPETGTKQSPDDAQDCAFEDPAEKVV